MNQPSLFPEPRRNAGLFSQYYLDEVLLSSLAEFADNKYDLGDEYFRTKFAELEPIIRENDPLAGKRNEAQFEEDVIRPILKNVLGHIYDVQVIHKGDKPDYFLFASEENKQASKKLNAGSDEYQKLNIGILDAKAWKRSSKPEKLDEANISQIFRYLINFKRRWGILTDGFRWLLFANKSGIRQDQYIEFNLSEIVKKGPASPDFRLFIFLFRRQAFDRIPGTNALLDKVLDQSLSNAAKLQNNLKQKVYEAFKIVAEEYRKFNKLKLDSEKEIAELKETSLIFLYRILFLLYGESRLILPVRPESEEYYSYSLERLLVEQMEKDRPNQYSKLYWHWLNGLFDLIHGLEPDGSRSRLGKDIELPAYDGGLFDPGQYKKLKEWKLGDKAIKAVMDLLTKTGERRDAKPVRVSYRDLGVQHLGNIYEGILENKIVLSEDGSVDVVTDNFERHATGSYYTPDYIVDYIVKETLQPIVDEAINSPSFSRRGPGGGQADKKKREQEVEEAILRIKVLDPAMGSGHFLIGAIDFLAEELAKKGDPDAKYTEAELQECRRRVGEQCVYGVDLNPMAVELAKLSIWLHTLSQSKPLTFLDNHIKWGNSLIGARKKDIATLPPRSKKAVVQEVAVGEGLFPNHFLEQDATSWLADGRLFKLPSDNIVTVQDKEHLEDELDKKRDPYRKFANFWTSLFYTKVSNVDASIILRELGAIRDYDHPKLVAYSTELDEAELIANQKCFFHWELEFPEIFLDKFGRHNGEEAGFDAVIGNPPYVYARQSSLTSDRPFVERYYETAEYQSNLYVLFLENARRLGHKESQSGFIIPNSWLGNLNFTRLRHMLLTGVQFKTLLSTPPGTFEGVSEEMVVFTFSAKPEDMLFVAGSIDKLGEVKKSNSLDQRMFLELEGSPISLRASTLTLELLKKVSSISDPLTGSKSNPIFRINRGVNPYDALTGQSKEIIATRAYHASYKKDETFVPEFKGSDLQRYNCAWSGYTWISYGDWLAAPRSPEFFEGKRIVFRKILGKNFECSILEEKMIIDQSVYIALPISPVDLPYTLSLLNSRLLAFLFRIKFDEFDLLFPQIKVEQFEQLPIRNIDFTSPKKEREKLSKMLITQSEEVISSNESEEQIKQKLQPTIALAKKYSEEKNDVLHDFLSHLAEQMLAMNKEKQAHVNEFFEWMGHYGIKPREEMKPKTFLDEYWKKEFKHILAYLTRNKVMLGIQNEKKLLERFNASSAALLSLDKKIGLTDWLIDQVVYALYGLTDEEIAVVEGS